MLSIEEDEEEEEDDEEEKEEKKDVVKEEIKKNEKQVNKIEDKKTKEIDKDDINNGSFMTQPPFKKIQPKAVNNQNNKKGAIIKIISKINQQEIILKKSKNLV